ncbi:MAG: GTPase ObgE [Flexistipes sinusarabici]|uniref:GTPase Obg n=1 Tax=Flexistipes sinusarabici TaxID=2352 RepID=A0A5D0MSM4_FLESI|nr:GTPase ObgE [Flexistipes sinusarabici]TYB34888.1 MAG: GTPase ObgE [Flexistipes sinusarabici]
MKFLDTTKIKIKAGDGGRGCVSFRREKYVPRGGPDGGSGGSGGSIVLVGNRSKYTLLDLNYKTNYSAERGEHGRGKDQHGRKGRDLEITVPLGTIVKDYETGKVLGDITEDGQRLVAAKGGKGGRGNMAFVNSTRRAPRISEDGEKGEERTLLLELKLIADVGIIGLPNAGKSTFIASVSAAKPKIADYPFTTITPNLGVVKNIIGGAFVLADMPGLVEGAYENAGLGVRFLKHIERTRILLHFVDASDEGSMIERYKTIRDEILRYSGKLSEKEEIIAATKVDSKNEDNLEEFEKFVNNDLNKQLYKISSVAREGIDNLLRRLWERLQKEDSRNGK